MFLNRDNPARADVHSDAPDTTAGSSPPARGPNEPSPPGSPLGHDHRRRARRPWSLAARLTGWYAISGFLLLLVPTFYLYVQVAREVYVENDDDVLERFQRLQWILRQDPLPIAQLSREINVEPLMRPRDEYLVRIIDEQGRTLWETPRLGKLLPPGIFSVPPAAPDDSTSQSVAAVRRGRLRRFSLTTARSPMEKHFTSAGRPFLICSATLVADRELPPDPSIEPRGAASEHAGAPPATGEIATRSAGVAGGASQPRNYTVQIAMDESSDERMLAAYRSDIFIVMGIGLVACIFISYLIANSGLTPIEQMGKLVSGISSTALTRRVQPTGFPSELWALAERFNNMLDRLQDAFERLSRFSADIAHELRTPLSNLRGETEVALGKPRTGQEYRDVLGSCLEEYVRLSRMIDSLLFLARAENPETKINRERLDIKRELESLRDFYEASAEDARVELKVLAAEGLRANVDRLLLQRAIGNLVENALAFTPSGGKVTITATESRLRGENGEQNGAAPAVRIEVSDTGCGIPPEHLPYIFDRFRRVDEARSKDHSRSARGRKTGGMANGGQAADGADGASAPSAAGAGAAVIDRAGLGLGLSIVKGIATLHGGAAQIESRPGVGTRVILIFPAG